MNLKAGHKIIKKMRALRLEIIAYLPDESDKPYMDALLRELAGVEGSLRNRISIEEGTQSDKTTIKQSPARS